MLKKTNLTPLPPGSSTSQWVQASDWNTLQGSHVGLHNITSPEFGAVSAINPTDPTQATSDATLAIYSAIQAWQQTLAYPYATANATPTGGVYIPEGNYYISQPICLPAHTKIFGDGENQSVVLPGPGTPATPGLVQGFAGPMFYVSGTYQTSSLPNANFPTYGAPLVGATGQSLVMANPIAGSQDNSLWLHDCFFLGTLGQYPLQAFTCQFWCQIADAPAGGLFKHIVGSRGPNNVWSQAGDIGTDIAFGVYAVCDDGINIYLRAYLTTSAASVSLSIPFKGTQQFINSSPITRNTPIHVEMSFDQVGGFFDFFVNGVSQGHLVATGSIVRAPWEGVSIGPAGPEFSTPPTIACITGFVDSVRFSNVARHTGTGSFTPPAAKYTWDSSTMALYNWDQPVPTVPGSGGAQTMPFIVGQAAIQTSAFTSYPTTGPLAGPVPHYIRLTAGSFGEWTTIRDLQLMCQWNTAGIVGSISSRTTVENVTVQLPTQFGVRFADSTSFFCKVKNLNVFWAAGTALQLVGDAEFIQTVGSGIGTHLIGGLIRTDNDQPSFSSFCPFIFGPGSAQSSNVLVEGCASDQEAWQFVRQRAGAIVMANLGSFVSIQNAWSCIPSTQSPILYLGAPVGGGVHIGDYFQNESGAAGTIYKYGSFSGNVTVISPNIGTSGGTVIPPISNQNGWVTVLGAKQINNQTGLSTTDTQANNLAGTFQVVHGFTFGGPAFLTPEPDAKYDVTFTLKGFTGSAPAAGSTTITGYTPGVNGFTATVGADPGGTCILTFSYHLIRTAGDSMLDVQTPAIPSTPVNPLATVSPTGDWCVGVSIIPASGNCFAYNGTATQTIVEAGTAPGTNFWGLDLIGGFRLEEWSGSSAGLTDSYLATNGRLCGILNPGSHNLVYGRSNGVGLLYIDLGQFPPFNPSATGTQQTPLNVGQRSGGTQTLTVATLRNLRVDTNPNLVASNEPDMGPGSKVQGAFLGDTFTMGASSTSSSGGFATQIAQNRYSTKYYWIAVQDQDRMISPSVTGMAISDFWLSWGTKQTLTGLCIMGGFYDLLADGATATNVWNSTLNILQGNQASTFFIPNTAGTATCVINGVSFNSVFNTNAQTTANNLAAAINASAPTNTIVTATVTFTTGWVVQITAIARGTSGNAITVSTNGTSGASFYSLQFIGTGFYSSGTLAGAVAGAIGQVGTIVLCTVPPFGQAPAFTAGKETQRNNLNTTIRAFTGTGVTIADADVTLRDPANHQNILAANLAPDNTTLTNAGHTALFGLINPLLP